MAAIFDGEYIMLMSLKSQTVQPNKRHYWQVQFSNLGWLIKEMDPMQVTYTKLVFFA